MVSPQTFRHRQTSCTPSVLSWHAMTTRDHRIIEWFELEGTPKDHLHQPPCHGQGHLSLDQAAQRSVSDLPSLHPASNTSNCITAWNPFPRVRDISEKGEKRWNNDELQSQILKDVNIVNNFK